MREASRNAPPRRCPQDDGFTLLEVILAMAITIGVMLAMAGLMVGALKTIEQARQRQTATALATQQLERLRALPYDTVTKPVPSATLGTGLQYVVNVAGVNRFQPTAIVPGLDEPLVVNNYSGQVTTQTVSQVTYKIQTYVSVPPAASSGAQAYHLAAIVTWSSSVNPTGKYVIERSTSFSAAACLSTSTSPFSSACQNYYTAQAGQALAGVTITDPTDSTQNIQGLDATSLQMAFGGTSTNVQVEQTVSGTTTSTTTGASRKAAGTTSSVDAYGASANFDSDPSSTPNQVVLNTTPSQATTSVSATGSGGTLTLTPTNQDAGQAAGAVAADTAYCTGTGGTGLITGPSGQLRPCSAASMQAKGTSGAVTYASPAGTQVQLASFSQASGPSLAVSSVLAKSNTGACTGVTVDCSHAATSTKIGDVNIGNGLVKVSGLQESALAEEGVGRLTPTFTRQGTITIGGSSAQTVLLSSYATPAAGTVPVSTSFPVNGSMTSGNVTVGFTGSVIVQSPKMVSTPATRSGDPTLDCKTTACRSTVSGAGGVVINLTVTVTVGGSQTTQFAMVVNLGGAVADASFKQAQNG